MLQMKPENVRCIYVEGAGCYGRNGSDDCSSEAALIAKEIGRPVRLQWMRQDEHGWDPKGPPTPARLSRQHRRPGPDRRLGIRHLPARAADAALGRDAARGRAREPAEVRPVDAPASTTPGSGIPYALPNNKLTAHWLVDTPLPAAWIRAPARMQNTFGNESFLDEIAAATGVDPFEIRMRHLTDPRGLELLERLRQFAKWEPRGTRPRDTGAIARGRGVSYAKYELVRTYVGIVADVTRRSHDGTDQGRSRVRRARLRPDHQPRRPAQPDRRQRRADREPQRGREADVQPQCGHQPQLGKLSDPDVSQRARGRDRSDRPAERGSVGCGRADDVRRAFGDRQCGVRRHRRAVAIGAVQAAPPCWRR